MSVASTTLARRLETVATAALMAAALGAAACARGGSGSESGTTSSSSGADGGGGHSASSSGHGGEAACDADPDITAGGACKAAIGLGTLSDVAGDKINVTGNTQKAGRVVWWSFEATDDTDTAGDEFHVDVRFITNPSNAYQMDVYRGSCDVGDRLASAEKESFDWFTDFATTDQGCSASTPCGEGDCVPAPGEDGKNTCDDDTSTFYLGIKRTDGKPTCDVFKLEMSNGTYSSGG